MAVLLRRHGWLLVKEPTLYLARAVIFVVSSVFFSIIYIDTRQRTQAQATARLYYVCWLLPAITAPCVIALASLNRELAIIVREVKAGSFQPAAYVLAQTTIQLTMMGFLCLVTLLPSGYGIGDWPWSRFGPVLLLFTLTLWVCENMAQLFALVPNVLVGMLGLIVLWFFAYLFSGLLVNQEDVVWPLRLMVYALPFKWSNPAILWNVFIDTPDYEGVSPCEPTPTSCHSSFYCPDDPYGLQCYGRTGTEILRSFSGIWPAFNEDNTWLSDCAILAAMALGWKALFVLAFSARCAVGSSPRALLPSPTTGLVAALLLAGAALLFVAAFTWVHLEWEDGFLVIEENEGGEE